MDEYYVYILANKRNGTIYTGITNELLRRISEHREKVNESFTKQYDVTKLVYYEATASVEAAISREKQIKGWKREWKLELIEKNNPTWKDLFDEL